MVTYLTITYISLLIFIMIDKVSYEDINIKLFSALLWPFAWIIIIVFFESYLVNKYIIKNKPLYL